MDPVADTQIWNRIREEAARDGAREPMLASFLDAAVLTHETLEDALGFVLASRLEGAAVGALSLRDLFAGAHAADPRIGAAARADLQAVATRDPACRGYSVPLLWFKGFQAIQAHRVAHHCWAAGRHTVALFLQSRISEVFGVDVHPAARIGKGILLDHATGVVIGETAVVDDDVSMLHEVTLGGTGKESGDRHPKIRRGVMIGAGAKVLGNIVVGEGAKIGAGSVVVRDVPPHATVAGVPARVVGRPAHAVPALEMDQSLELEATRDGAAARRAAASPER
jgi:serine O-acetyltransferase